MYNTDIDKSGADWVREPIKGMVKTFDAPQFSSAVKWAESGRGKLGFNALGYMLNVSNDRIKTPQGVGIFSCCLGQANGLSILASNFNRVTALFAARFLVNEDTDWMTSQDQFFAPNEAHVDYTQFVNDSIVFSLFHAVSQQSSLRQITYKNKLHDIHNQFFFLSVKEMQDLAIANNFNELFNDCVGKQDSYVYNLLKTIKLSPDAQKVLDMARKLVVDSFPLRQAAHTVKPEMHLNAWDAGWYQIRNGILKDNFKDEYKAFTDAYKALASRMKPMVYTLGFLKG
jgi:hypothetical protein